MAESAGLAPEEQEDDEPVFGLSDRFIHEIAEDLQEGRREKTMAALQELSEADTAELISKLDSDDRDVLLKGFSGELDPLVFTELSWDLRRVVLPELPPAQIAAIISELDSDDALDIIQSLDDEEFRHAIIHQLSARTRMIVQEGMSFPENSAGRLMQREFVAVPKFWTAGKTIDYLRAAADDLPDEFFDIIVIEPGYHVAGTIPLSRLVRATRAEKLEMLRLEDIHAIPATMDQEDVAGLFRRENLTSAPVVDDENRLIGVITVDDVVDVIDEEAQDDLLKLGGVGGGDLYKAAFSTSLSRSYWLFINLWTAFAAASIVNLFTGTIERVVALATLMPIVAGMGGNAGTQTLAVIVRAIAVRELSGANAPRAVYKEAVVGFMNGVIFSLLIGITIAWFYGNITLGAVIGGAMIINLIMAGTFGALIPIGLHKFGYDPAITSSIFLTTVTDCTGFFSFLGLAALFLT